jgi:hypothetical protein
MKKTKRKLKPKTYVVVARAIECGINHGWNRAFKYLARPSDERIKAEIEDAVMLALDEVINFDFDDEEA